jgi:hypothetical protein
VRGKQLPGAQHCVVTTAAPLKSLLTMFFNMRLARLLGMRARVSGMSACRMSVVRSLLMMARRVVFGGFVMVLRGLGMVFGCFGVMLRSLLRHRISSSARMVLQHLNSRLPLSVPSRIVNPAN